MYHNVPLSTSPESRVWHDGKVKQGALPSQVFRVMYLVEEKCFEEQEMLVEWIEQEIMVPFLVKLRQNNVVTIFRQEVGAGCFCGKIFEVGWEGETW